MIDLLFVKNVLSYMIGDVFCCKLWIRHIIYSKKKVL